MTTFNTDYLIMLVQKVIWWSYSFQLKARQLESTELQRDFGVGPLNTGSMI